MSKSIALVANAASKKRPSLKRPSFKVLGEPEPYEIVKEYVGFGDAADELGEAFSVALKRYYKWERNEQ